MTSKQTDAKRHGPSRVTTVICLALIILAVLEVVQSIEFESQIEESFPAILLDTDSGTGISTTLRLDGTLTRQMGEYDRFIGYLELGDQPFTSLETNFVMTAMTPANQRLFYDDLSYGGLSLSDQTRFGTLYTDRQYDHIFVCPSEIVAHEGNWTRYRSTSSIYVAPAESTEDAMSLLREYGFFNADGAFCLP